MAYVQIKETDVPDAVRFDVLPQNQGQMIEVAWGTRSRWQAAQGATYKRICDRTEAAPDKRVTYWRRK